MRNRATLILTTVKKALLATDIVKTGAYHAYYTVVSGDSQWAIVQSNGLIMYALVF